MAFSKAELEAFRDREVDDLVGPDVKLLFVGINPGLWTAAVGTHFAHPTNRFYPALAAAGITDYTVDRVTGMTEADRTHLRERGIAITNLVPRATARASELSREELLQGGGRLTRFVAEHRPAVVAVAGVSAYRHAFGDPRAKLGRQGLTADEADRWSGATLWIVPNPSGLNAHETITTLAAAYRAPALEAGVILA